MFDGTGTAIDPDDASGEKVWKCERVFETNLHVEEILSSAGRKRFERAGCTAPKPLAERNKRAREVRFPQILEPANRRTRLIDVCIEPDRASCGKLSLKAGCVIERQAEDGQPIGEAIVGNSAQR